MRCAVYTRKSTNEGLEQTFNTLDAQRESCVNYIASQKHEGWIALDEMYNDGGFTGANTERPALKKLISDIQERKIDCVVVYKVDRLSRSLSDFIKLLEYFETNKITFVSVTQHFNTKNSMGRLTLNILLSFAQFEREIISERTRDKMSAARKRGRWVGGLPMLGYDIDRASKTLIVNEEEACLVREIFELYIKKCSTMRVANILNEKDYKTKRHKGCSGRVSGGKSFNKTMVSRIISSYIYIGKVEYHSDIYDGQQPAIISEDLFYKVNKIRKENYRKRDRIKNIKDVSLLKHILWCKTCNTRMHPTYVPKNKKKYRYYVCDNAMEFGYGKCPTKSVNEIGRAHV